MESSLSSVPPVMPRPRPEIIGTRKPRHASSGASGRETLSPMPPVECLSTSGRGSRGNRSTSPESRMASVSAVVSDRIQPAKIDRHEERGHLVIGNPPGGKFAEPIPEFGPGRGPGLRAWIRSGGESSHAVPRRRPDPRHASRRTSGPRWSHCGRQSRRSCSRWRYRHLARGVGHVIQIALRIGVLEVDGRAGRRRA